MDEFYEALTNVSIIRGLAADSISKITVGYAKLDESQQDLVDHDIRELESKLTEAIDTEEWTQKVIKTLKKDALQSA